jgi:glutamyl-Q tRNA(Asp) synthetase
MTTYSPNPITGRFAPSPTGLLHTGSLVAAVGSWLMAKSMGGHWLLRIDDLDTPRLKPETEAGILKTLEAFGLHWDGRISRQSEHLQEYAAAFEVLANSGLVYPCGCSRKEIAQAASAPHQEDDCLTYPGTCRSGMRSGAVMRSWRIMVPDEDICFNDLRLGEICQNLTRSCGDVVLRRADDVFSYQLAVVVDDHLTGVNQVVRGDDLLSSTPRQIFIHRTLGLPEPAYCHLPLVTGPDGTKLSKRDNLVSTTPGNLNIKNEVLLWKILAFLGQEPPRDLSGANCEEILQWGIANFTVKRIPRTGGELHL